MRSRLKKLYHFSHPKPSSLLLRNNPYDFTTFFIFNDLFLGGVTKKTLPPKMRACLYIILCCWVFCDLVAFRYGVFSFFVFLILKTTTKNKRRSPHTHDKYVSNKIYKAFFVLWYLWSVTRVKNIFFYFIFMNKTKNIKFH